MVTDMVIQKGYKQTELGVIPNDWEPKSLGEIADSKSPICYGIVQVGPYVEDGVPVLAIKNLGNDYKRNIHKSLPKIEASYVRSRIRPNDVLISVKGTTGRVGIVPEGFNGNISRDLARFRISDKHSPRFMFQLLRSDFAQKKLNAATVGTTRMELSIGILKKIKMPCPTIGEQSLITEILDGIDRLIEKLENIITKKRMIKQGATQELLTGKRRLSGFSRKWELRKLEELCDLNKGFQINKSTLTKTGKYPVWNGGIEPSGYTGKWNTIENTITISEGGNSCGFVNYCTQKFWCGGHCYAVQINNDGINQLFFYHKLKYSQSIIMGLRVGSGLPNIQKKNLFSLELNLPKEKNEQIAISDILTAMDSEIDKLEQQLIKYKMLKQGMMQALLTGKVRLV